MSDTSDGDDAVPENENWLENRLRSSVPIAHAGPPDASDWVSPPRDDASQANTAAQANTATQAHRAAESAKPAPPVSPIDALFADSPFEQYEFEQPGSYQPESTGRAAHDPLERAPSGQQAYDQQSIVDQPARNTREKISPFWAMAAVMAVLALGALFFLGTKLPVLLASAADAPVSASPTPIIAPSPTPTPTGQAALGEQPWTQLRGGECITPFTGVFAEKFTVVDCAEPHAAQMVFRGTFPEASGALAGSAESPYPGDAALQPKINLLCTAPGVIDLAMAGAYDNIEVQAGYAASAAEWDSGQRDYFCFVTRSEAQMLEGSVVGTLAGHQSPAG